MKLGVPGRSGFTLIEIMIVVAIIGLLAVIAIPSYVHVRNTSQLNACVNNLRVIDNAKQNWALERQAAPTATPGSGDIQPYLGRGLNGSLPFCPVDAASSFSTSYSINNLGSAPTCLIVPATHVYN